MRERRPEPGAEPGAAWPPPRVGDDDARRARAPNPWAELLRQAEQARRERAERRRGMETGPRVRGPRLGGCLVQLVLVGLLLLFALASGFFMFAGSLFQLFRFF
jgi:hypothetical protein